MNEENRNDRGHSATDIFSCVVSVLVPLNTLVFCHKACFFPNNTEPLPILLGYVDTQRAHRGVPWLLASPTLGCGYRECCE